MPRVEYPKSRRLLMQVVLCLILCASVGLAALVTHDHRLGGSTRLAGTRYVESIGVRLPAGWILERSDQGQVLFVAREPDSPDKHGRRLIVQKRQVDPTTSSEKFLQSSGLLNGTLRLVPADPDNNTAQSITVAGLPGVMLAVKKPVGGFLFLAPTGFETELFAASVRPTGLALSLQLECPDDSDPQSDEQTLRDIAAAMDVQDTPQAP